MAVNLFEELDIPIEEEGDREPVNLFKEWDVPVRPDPSFGAAVEGLGNTAYENIVEAPIGGWISRYGTERAMELEAESQQIEKLGPEEAARQRGSVSRALKLQDIGKPPPGPDATDEERYKWIESQSLSNLLSRVPDAAGALVEKGRTAVFGASAWDKAKRDTEAKYMREIAAKGQKMAREAMKEAEAKKPFFGDSVGDMGLELFWDLGTATEKMVPTIVTGYLTRNPALASSVFMTSIKGEAYAANIEKGQSHEEADLNSTVTAAIEGATELIPMAKALQFGSPAIKRILKVVGWEGVTEGISSLLQTMYDAGYVNDDTTIKEALLSLKTWKDAGYETVIGMMLGGLLGGMGVASAGRIEKKIIEEIKDTPGQVPLQNISDSELQTIVERGSQLADAYNDEELGQIIDIYRGELNARAMDRKVGAAVAGTASPTAAGYEGEAPADGFVQRPYWEEGQPEGNLSEFAAWAAQQRAQDAAQASPEATEEPTGAEGKPTMPEKPETLQAQLDAFRDGRRRGVLFGLDDELPDPQEGEALAGVPSEPGILLYKESDPEALQMALGGQIGDVLGYGINEQPADATHVVTARNADGVVVQDVVTDGSPEVEEAGRVAAGEGGTIEIRPIDEALSERAGLSEAPDFFDERMKDQGLRDTMVAETDQAIAAQEMPDWFAEIKRRHKVSSDYVANALRKSVEGGKLGSKQQKVVGDIIGHAEILAGQQDAIDLSNKVDTAAAIDPELTAAISDDYTEGKIDDAEMSARLDSIIRGTPVETQQAQGQAEAPPAREADGAAPAREGERGGAAASSEVSQEPRVDKVQKDAEILGKSVSKYTGGKREYTQNTLPDSLSGIGSAYQTAFGKRIVAFTPNSEDADFFNGVHISENPDVLYLNLNSNQSWIGVVGHELLHALRKQSPDLYNYLLTNASSYFRNVDQYRDELNKRLGKGESKVSMDVAVEELLADFTGDALSDPEFLKLLARDNSSKFSKLLNFITLWLAKIRNKLRGLGSEQYISDVDALRQYLREVLNIYAERGVAGIDSLSPPTFMVAWHGSPHRWENDRPDIAKGARTGTGGLAQGWGLYLAESKGVGEYYKNITTQYRIAVDGTQIDIDDNISQIMEKVPDLGRVRAQGLQQLVRRVFSEPTIKSKDIKDVIEKEIGIAKDFIDSYREMMEDAPYDEKALMQDEIEFNQRIIDAAEFLGDRLSASGGNLYELDVNQDAVDSMLLWDREMAAQPQSVIDALRDEGLFEEADVDQELADKRFRNFGRESSYRGADMYAKLVAQKGGSKRAASEFLLSKGIRGIKYLDANSRKPVSKIKREFLDALPEDADFADVMEMAKAGVFSEKHKAVFRELDKNYWLGFDYPAQAIEAAYSKDLQNYDPTPELVKAVQDSLDPTYNLVMFDENDVTVVSVNGEPVEAPRFSRTFRTGDGYTFVELEDGRIADNPNPDRADMIFEDYADLKAQLGDAVYAIDDEVGAKRSYKWWTGEIPEQRQPLKENEIRPVSYLPTEEDLKNEPRFSRSRMIAKPKRTLRMYKLLATKKSQPGQVFPLFISKSEPTPLGEWLKAEFIPTKGYAERPGWHVAPLPHAPHLMKKDGTMQEGRVWTEVEVPNDVDWQAAANASPTKDLRKMVPERGLYRFPRPKNQGGEWIIAGGLKINRILSDAEVEEILRKARMGMKFSRKPATGRQAKKGGELGINGQWYRGGEFMPASAFTVKGQYKQAKGERSNVRSVLVEPGITRRVAGGSGAEAWTPIFGTVSEFVTVSEDGQTLTAKPEWVSGRKAELLSNFFEGPDYVGELEYFIDSYNDGARLWRKSDDALDTDFDPSEIYVDESTPQYSRKPIEVAGYEVRETTGADDNGPAPSQGDLFTATGLPSQTFQTQAADTFDVVYKQVPVGSFKSGLDRVRTAEDVAHVIAPIRKRAQEVMLAVVTGRQGKILNIIKHTSGTKDASSVDPVALVGAIAATPGAANVWYAHNHPSANPDPSQADYRITERMRMALDGLNVKHRGHVVVGSGMKAMFIDPEWSLGPADINIRPMRRKLSVSYTERAIRKNRRNEQLTIDSPASAMAVINLHVSADTGLLLLDNRHNPVGVVALSPEEMRYLRDGKQVKRILSAIDTTNASAGVSFIKNVMGPVPAQEALQNLGNFLRRHGEFRLLDALYPSGAGGLRSSAQRGDDANLGDADKPFFSRKPDTEWYEGSKIVDTNGEPMVLYRGRKIAPDAERPNSVLWATNSPHYAGFYATWEGKSPQSYDPETDTVVANATSEDLDEVAAASKSVSADISKIRSKIIGLMSQLDKRLQPRGEKSDVRGMLYTIVKIMDIVPPKQFLDKLTDKDKAVIERTSKLNEIWEDKLSEWHSLYRKASMMQVDGGYIEPVYIVARNPFYATRESQVFNENEEWFQKLRDRGYDSIIWTPSGVRLNDANLAEDLESMAEYQYGSEVVSLYPETHVRSAVGDDSIRFQRRVDRGKRVNAINEADAKKAEDLVTRTLEHLRLRIPEAERIARGKSGEKRLHTSGVPFSSLDLTKTADKVSIDDDGLSAIWEEALQKSGARARSIVMELGMMPKPAKFWNNALQLNDRARYWYEISAEQFQKIMKGLTVPELKIFIDIVSATSPLVEPVANLRRATAVFSQYLAHVPIDTDVLSPPAVHKAVAEGSLSGLKTGSFAGTMQYVIGIEPEAPLSTNDRQVASSFGISGDDIAKNPALYEVLSRFYIGLRNKLNEQNPSDPYETWQLQALGWVGERTSAGSIFEDDYWMAITNVSSKTKRKGLVQVLNEAGIPASVNGITRQALQHESVPLAMSGTLSDYRKALKGTIEINTMLDPVLKEAHEMFMEASRRGDHKAVSAYLANITSALKKASTGDNAIDKLAPAIVGRSFPTGLTRKGIPSIEAPYDYGGTFEGEFSPNLVVPLKGFTTDQARTLLAAIGSAWKQKAMASSVFMPAKAGSKPAEGAVRTHAIFIETEEDLGASPNTALRFADMLPSGAEVISTVVPNGYVYNITPAFTDSGMEPVSYTAAVAAADGALSNYRTHITDVDFYGTYDEKERQVDENGDVIFPGYQSIINKWKRDIRREEYEPILKSKLVRGRRLDPKNPELYTDGSKVQKSIVRRVRKADGRIRGRIERFNAAVRQARGDFKKFVEAQQKWIDAHQDLKGEEPSFSRKPDAARDRRLRGGDTGAATSYGRGKANSVSVTGVHYSKEQRQSLSGDYYGTGMRGAEASRVAQSADPRLRQRIHFYVDTGAGISPESGVGPAKHTVRLNNLYNLIDDPLGFRELNPELNDADWFSSLESNALDAGFDGVYNPQAQGSQGVAVLLGQHNVPITETPSFSRKASEFAETEFRNSKAPDGTLIRDNFNKWAGEGATFVEPEEISRFDFSRPGPYVLRAYHGTTHTVEQFNSALKGMYEGYFGRINYFTSSEYDANANYAGEGPDLTIRVERMAEQIADDEGIDMYDALQKAREYLHGGNEQVIEVYIRTENPFVVGDNSPWFEAYDLDEMRADAEEIVADNNGVDVETVKGAEEYEDEVQEAIWEIQGDTENPLISAIERVAYRYDVDTQKIMGEMYDLLALDPEIRHERIDKLLRDSEELSYSEDPDTGDLIGNHFIAEVIQELGFDSIILQDANIVFANMEMELGTAHIHVFDANNTNIKSVDNTGTFSTDTSEIRFARRQPPSPFQAENERLREEDNTVWRKAKRLLRRQLTPQGLLPQEAFDAKMERDPKIQADEFVVRHYARTLEKEVKKAYGKRFEKLDQQTVEMLNDAIHGNVSANIPANVRAVLVSMRMVIDDYSHQLANSLLQRASRLSGLHPIVIQRIINQTGGDADAIQQTLDAVMQQQLANAAQGSNRAGIYKDFGEAFTQTMRVVTILSNMGEYVNRSYRAFDDENWFKKLPNDVIDDARQYLRQQYLASGMSPTDANSRAENLIHELVKTGTAYNSMSAYIAEGRLGAKDLSILKRKNLNIAPEILSLLGEYRDPRTNFVKSISKMSRLIWNQHFLNRLEQDGRGVWLFTKDEKPPEATEEIPEGSEVYSPLSGYWMLPDAYQGLKDAVGKENMESWYRSIIRWNGIIKGGKTVGSPTTAFRNWMSAGFFAAANGHFNLLAVRHSIKGLREYFAQTGSQAQLDYLKELIELGVIYESPYAGEMMRLISDAKFEQSLIGYDNSFAAALNWILKNAKQFYSYGDDFWKIAGFEQEKAALMKTGLFSEQEAKVEAAQRIRNTYPTYALVGRGVKQLARFPLAGTFVSFPAEIIRTSYNILGYMAKDMKTPGMRRLGLRRLVGVSFVSSVFAAIQALSAARHGVDDDEDEAVRVQSPPWERNSSMWYTGRDKNGYLTYFDLSFLDPYAFWKRPIMAILRDQPWEDAFKQAAYEALTPFFGSDIMATAIVEVVANKNLSYGGPIYPEDAGMFESFIKSVDHLRRAGQPGIFNNAERAVKAAMGYRTKSGRVYKLEDEIYSFFGWRPRVLDPRTSMYYRAFDFKEAKAGATRRFSKIAQSPNDVTDKEIRRAYEETVRYRAKAYQQMGRVVWAAQKSGMSEVEVASALRLSGISKADVNALLKGEVAPWSPSKSSMTRAKKKASLLFSDQHAREIERRYHLLRD